MSPTVITLIAVFVGTAALCAGVSLSIANYRHDDPRRRVAKLNRNQHSPEMSSGLVKQELLKESAEGLMALWQRVGISPHRISVWLQQAELPIAEIGRASCRERVEIGVV